MALPKINSTPKYTITIPSTQKQTRFRPFLVKEEKVLMIAQETKDPSQMYNAIVDTILACIQEPIERNSLTTFDIEYLFVKIRSKSVGETAEFSLKCEKCNTFTKVSVNVDDINITVPKVKDIVELTDDIKLKMKWPRYTDIIKQNIATLSTTEQALHTISYCIDSILTADDAIKISDQPIDEVVSFLEELSTPQLKMLQDYISKIPQLTHTIKYTCSCGHENSTTLSGIQDFF